MFSNALASPSIASTAIFAFFERAVGEQGAAVDVTDRVDVRDPRFAAGRCIE